MRCFIVGNGPSLAFTPVDRLAGEITFACNRINLIYPFTDWRPSFYVRVETPNDDDVTDFWNDCREHIEMGVQCIFPSAWKKELGDHSNIEWVNSCHHYKYPAEHKKAPREWHLPMLCDFGGAIACCIQLAVMKDFDEIYLLGCDLGYTGRQDHFYDSSKERRQPPEMANAIMLHAHRIAKLCSHIPIYNATIGGELEIYPRVNIYDLLPTSG